MTNPADIKQTPRYQQMVANLKSRPVYVQEAALLKELANGKQWRIDAAVEAIEAKKSNWNYIDINRVFEQAGIYGRLSTIKALSESDYFKKLNSASDCSGQVIAAFDAAVMHGHYHVADYCRTLGADPQYYLYGSKPQKAMRWAVTEGNERKMDYLIKAGEEPKYSLNQAIRDGNKKVLDFLLDKGADVNYAEQGLWTPFVMAVKYENNDLARYLLKKGANFENRQAAGEAMYTAIADNNIEMAQVMIDLGVKLDKYDLEHAQYGKNREMIALIAKHMTPKITGYTPTL